MVAPMSTVVRRRSEESSRVSKESAPLQGIPYIRGSDLGRDFRNAREAAIGDWRGSPAPGAGATFDS